MLFRSGEWGQIDRLWQEFTGTDPASLNHWLTHAQLDAPNWLQSSLLLLTRRFPQRGIGLSSHVTSLLRLLKSSPVALHVILGKFLSDHSDDRDLPGDIVLEAHLRQLATPLATVPLIAFGEINAGMVGAVSVVCADR